MRTVLFLLRKEFRQILRDRTMLRMLILLPVVQLLVLSSAATFEVREAKMWVVDLDHSVTSRGLVQRAVATGRFAVAGRSTGMDPADEALLGRQASMVLRIPHDFERDLVRGGHSAVQVILDAEDGAAAGVIHAYFQQILRRYGEERGREIGLSVRPEPGGLDVRTRGWFNPELDYQDYMVPGILVVLVTIVAMAITSMNIVREKEIGTLEQLNVTPVTRTQFIAGKLIPFWVIALVDLALGLTVARLVFQIPLAGSLWLVALGALVYLVVALGLGLLISTLVETQQQAIFVSFSFNMVYLLVSGLFTPVSAMPTWARWAAQLSPVKHFIEFMRDVLVRGAGFDTVAVPLGILALYGAVVLTLAVRQYSKTSA